MQVDLIRFMVIIYEIGTYRLENGTLVNPCPSFIDVVLRSLNDLEIFGFLTRPTLSMIESYTGADNGIIYAILHESIYCQG